VCSCDADAIPVLGLLGAEDQGHLFSSPFLPPGDGFLASIGVVLPSNIFTCCSLIPVWVWRAVVNSVFYASVSSVLTTLCAAMGGYALAKFAFRANRLLSGLVLASLIIPTIVAGPELPVNLSLRAVG